MSRGEADL
ncbi:hypothetical protein E2C01_101580 [Portunus trituberculatus]|uniref:Uncharacterized protein n=1 Tax=Portunus trituberculatus TaxID=210409 RepID=A0A5B7K608_PORTR|nr:hypothetical protein [Portunus trituberculatus]